MGVGQKRGSLHVSRLIEHEQALVAVSRHLQHLEAHLADALATVPITQHHRQSGGEIPEAVVAGARFARDSEALVLRCFVLGERGRVWEAGARQRQGEDTERGMPGARGEPSSNGGRQTHPGSDNAAWIPAFAGMTAPTLVRHIRGSGNDSPHGVCPKALFRHSREGGNPVTLLQPAYDEGKWLRPASKSRSPCTHGAYPERFPSNLAP